MLNQQKINALKQQMKIGIQVVTAPQLFPTPPNIANQMVDLLDPQQGNKILEPSAGTGNLLNALSKSITFEYGYIQAIEINANLCNRLKANYNNLFVTQCDFLDWYPRGEPDLFDRIIMNPPFINGADIKHIKYAASFLASNGLLVALCAGGNRQYKQLEPLSSYWEPLPDGSFLSEGANVNTVLLTIEG